MCAADLNTERRGRFSVPNTFPLTRLFRFSLIFSIRFVATVLPLQGAPFEEPNSPKNLSSNRLADLTSDHFSRVLDPLALVRFRFLQASDLCGDTPDQLFVDTGYGDIDLLVHLDLNAIRNRILDRSGKTDDQLQGLARDLSTESNPGYLEVLFKTAQTPLTILARRVLTSPW